MITAIIDAGQHYCQAVSDLWQWDYGQTLRIQGVKLPAAVEVQFSTTERIGETVTRIGVTKDGVTEVPIPDTLLEGGGTTQDYTIYAFVYIENGDSGKTEYRVSMKVRARPKPEAHATPEEGELFWQAIVAVAESADRAESARKSAEASADEAKTAKENAETAAKNAEAFKTETETAKTEAVQAATEATAAKESAEEVRAAAEKAKQDAEAAKATAEKLAKKVETAKEEIQESADQIQKNAIEIDSLKEDLAKQEIYTEGFKKSAVINDTIGETLYSGMTSDVPNTINKMYDSKNKLWQSFTDTYYGVVQKVAEGEQYKITGTSINERFKLVNFFDSLDTDKAIDFYPKITEPYSNFTVSEKILTVPKNAIYMVINSQYNSILKIEKVTGYKDFKTETQETLNILKQVSNDVSDKASELDKSCVRNVPISESIYEGVAGDSPNIINKMCFIESNYWQTFDNTYCGISLEVTKGEQYIISGTNVNSNFVLINLFDSLKEDIKGMQYYPTKSMVDANANYYENLNIENYVITIPSGCMRMVINSRRGSVINIRKVTGYKDFKTETQETLVNLGHENDLKDFKIKNLQQRLLDTGKYNDFAFKEFDKTYFAFVIDDSSDTLYPIYKIFHEKGVKLSSATIPSNLSISVDGIGTNKDVLDLLVADGGEVLAHYYGNLIDIGGQAPNTDHNYLNAVEDWDSRIVTTKKELEDMGYKVRCIIRADYTPSKTKTGEQYCREYYDYSDGLGISPQYTLSRKFVHNFSTVEDFKNWIDKCCETPGFYPICTHGSEPINSNIDEVLDYIVSKNNCECTTYEDVYDRFRSTVLENRIKTLEEKIL